jgi:hypothetical protein
MAERIYITLQRRFSNVAIEFPMTEKEAKKLSAQGPKALREKQFVERNGTILFHKFYLQHKEVCQDILYMIANYYTQGY